MAGPTVTLEWFPAEGPGTAGITAAAITGVLSGTTFTGRQYELDRFAAGTATFQLANKNRNYDPEYTAGPYFGQLIPLRQIRLRATIFAVTYDIWRGYIMEWGQAVPGSDNVFYSTITCADATAVFERMGLPGSWFDLAVSKDAPTHWWRLNETAGTIAADSGSGTARHGTYMNGPALADAVLVPYSAGDKSVTLDSTVPQYVLFPAAASESATNFSLEVWFSTTMAALGSGVSTEIVRIGHSTPGITLAMLDNVAHAEFLGSNPIGLNSTTAVNDGHPHQLVLTRTGTTATAYLDGVSIASGTTNSNALQTDEFAAGAPNANNAVQTWFNGSVGHVIFWTSTLSATQVANHYNAGMLAHSGDDTGTHIGRVLDYKGFPSSLRNISTGTSTVGAYELNANNVAEFIQQMADTEGGATYVSPDGKLTHRARSAFWTDARSTTSQATFGDAHSAATLTYVAEGFSLTKDVQLIRNPVTAQRSAGTAYTASDTTYTAKYGDGGWSAPVTYDSSDNVSIDRAHVFLGRYKELGTRLENMRIVPQRSPTLLFPQALGRLIGDRITVKRKPLNTGNETSLDQIIEAVKHTFDPHLWTTEWRGSPPETANYGLYNDGTIYDDGTVMAY